MNMIQQIKALADRLDKGELEIAELSLALEQAQLTRIPSHAWKEVEARLDCEPRFARALGYILRAMTQRRRGQQRRGRANLMLIRALNACAEFRAAYELCVETAPLFQGSKYADAFAQLSCEAAYAQTFLGNLELADQSLASASHEIACSGDTCKKFAAKVKWIRARILRERAKFEEAEELFQNAREQLLAEGDTLNAARCLRELGRTYVRSKPSSAPSVLASARHVFDSANCPIESALCDYFTAQTIFNQPRFQEALQLLLLTRKKMTEQRLDFFVMWCNNDIGLCYRELGLLEEALSSLRPARDYFLRHGADGEASVCEINIGTVLEDLNRYDEAGQHYQKAAELARVSGRKRRLALCVNNLGWVRHKQGRYAEALDYYYQARDLFAQLDLAYDVAMYADLNSALAYLHLGQFQRAQRQLEAVREYLLAENRPGALAECELYLAETLLNLGQIQPAQMALEHAHSLFLESGRTLYGALCNRLLAQVSSQRGDHQDAKRRLAESRVAFTAYNQPIDVALCNLTEGELAVESGELAHGQAVLALAHDALGTAFPNYAWRADYGLGRIALAKGSHVEALQHHLDAVHAIADVRAELITEQWSNDFFASRQRVYKDTLGLAVRLNVPSAALDVVEAAKARTFVAYLTRREWKRASSPTRSGHSKDLAHQEAELRYQLAGWRARKPTHTTEHNGSLRGPDDKSVLEMTEWQEVNALSEQYEAVVTRLRLQNAGLAGAPSLTPFDVTAFRARADARWGRRWIALNYYYLDDILTIVYIDLNETKVYTRALSRYDRYVIEQCASVSLDMRKYIYNRSGTDESSVKDVGAVLLRHLYSCLIPQDLPQGDGITLLISPHGPLHQLPFHALKDGDTFLLERYNVIYAPALQAWMQSRVDSALNSPAQALVCGLDQFGERGAPLAHTADEVGALEKLFGARATTLWGSALQRSTFREWNLNGILRSFGYLHLATHAVIDSLAPHASRILLADEDLMVTDVLDLTLDARLVTLSACSSSGGSSGAGDEMIALARAFFYAGARALVASLWAVDDASAANLMERFYRRLIAGGDIADALRGAQIEMLREKFAPFHWAPFIAMGDA